ncbi:MAG: zinc ribbon domain-containing protein, partial [Candidatus Hodarchaeales archaeon]
TACGIFSWIAAKTLIRNDLDSSIINPWVVVRALGLAFFIGYIINYSLFSSLIKPVEESYMDEGLISVSIQPFVSWIFGGFYISKKTSDSIVSTRPKPIGLSSNYFYGTKNSVRPKPIRVPSKYSQRKSSPSKYCHICGAYIPLGYKFCRNCGSRISGQSVKRQQYLVVDFKEAVRQLDSEQIPRGKRMNIQFECIVYDLASPEKIGGPAPYRTIRVSDPNKEITRTLHVWGDYGHKHNINLVSTLEKGERILIIGSRRPKDSPYYKDDWGRDVFWIERWDGTENDTGTKLFKIEDKKEVFFEGKTKSYMSPAFYCQLCTEKHPAGTKALQCTNCGRFICEKSYNDMVEVGRKKCPMCDGKLEFI